MLHLINILSWRAPPRTANDIAQFISPVLRSNPIPNKGSRCSKSQDAATWDLSNSFHNNYISICGWALRKRKLGKPMSETVRDFIEQLWPPGARNALTILTWKYPRRAACETTSKWEKMFQIQDYPTKNQILYQCRKFQQKYGIDGKQKLIAEIIDQHTELQTDRSDVKTLH